MNKDQSPKLSDDQARMIAHEAFMAKVLKYRKPPRQEREAKPKWLSFMESPGAVALITVVLGGILGGAITAMFQMYQKDREFQRSQLKAQGEIALATSKEYRDKQLEIVGQAFDLLGRCITVSDNLIYLTNPVFDPAEYEDSLGVTNQRLAMLKAYNNCANEWREKSEKLKLLMSYYHHGRSEVVQSWQNVQDSATVYMKCAHAWYSEHSDDPTNTEGVCKAERDNYSKKIDQLNVNFSSARQLPLGRLGVVGETPGGIE